MSKAANLVRTLFTVVAVALSYEFEPQLASWLQSAQPHLASFAISLEAATIIVLPTFIFATFIIRQIKNARGETT